MNTYTYPKKEDVEIIVGDEKQHNFKPRMKIKRWDNEVNFSIGVISAYSGSDSQINDKVEWNDGHGMKARFYEKRPTIAPTEIPNSFRYINLGAITPDMMKRVYEIERYGIEPTIITYTPDADCYVVHGHQPFSDYIDKPHNINEVRLLNFGGNSPIMFGDPATAVIDIQFDSSIYSAQTIFDLVNDTLCNELKLHGRGRYYNDKDEKVATLIKSKNHVVGYIRGGLINRSKFLKYCNIDVNELSSKYKVGCVNDLDVNVFINSIGVSLNVDSLTYEETHYPRITGNYDYERLEIDVNEQRTNYQFEFEIVLSDEPTNRTIDLSIQTKGLAFYKQREYTDDELNGGHQPINTIGSYAVYHSSKDGDYSQMGGNNYRAGKAFHIYRPYATDSNNKRIWCDMLIVDDVLRITIPDELVYPIVIDPTFGLLTYGGMSYGFAAETMNGTLYTSPADAATANSLTVYMKPRYDSKEETYTGGNVKGVLILHSNLNIVTNGVGTSFNIPDSDATTWYTSTLSSNPTISPSTGYVLAIIIDSDKPALYLDGSDTDVGHQDSTNSYASPINPTDAHHNDNKYSIYCTYTAAAAGGARPPRVFFGPFHGALGGAI